MPRVRTPRIYWQATKRRVLTMEWIEGVKLTNKVRAQLAAALSVPKGVVHDCFKGICGADAALVMYPCVLSGLRGHRLLCSTCSLLLVACWTWPTTYADADV